MLRKFAGLAMPVVAGRCEAPTILQLPSSQAGARQQSVRLPACNAHQQPLPHIIANAYWLRDSTPEGRVRFHADLVPVDASGRPWPTHLNFKSGPGLHRGKETIDRSAERSSGRTGALFAEGTLEVQLPAVYEMAGNT